MNKQRITAEICREEAKAVAIEIQRSNDAEYKAALAAVGSFWVDMGRLSLDLGDPDELVEVLQQRRASAPRWKLP